MATSSLILFVLSASHVTPSFAHPNLFFSLRRSSPHRLLVLGVSRLTTSRASRAPYINVGMEEF